MIKYSESELADLLPSSMKENTDVQAISYAIKMATKKLIVYAGRARLSGGIEQVPEDILDLMALELRTQYYDESLSIETERNLIKNTMTWHERAGTPSAVEELIKIVFGVGEVVEWFDFDPNDGEIIPGQFDIETNATMTEQMAQDFVRIIEKAKRESSHLRRLLIRRSISNSMEAKSGLVQSSHATIDPTVTQSQEIFDAKRANVGLVQTSRQIIKNDLQIAAEHRLPGVQVFGLVSNANAVILSEIMMQKEEIKNGGV